MIDAEVEEQINDAVKLSKKIVMDMCNDKEFADSISVYYINLYNSLRSKGFKPDQAMQIVVNVRFPEMKK